MSILRRVHTRNFTVITNEVVNDTELSAEALGVLVYLLGRPHDWIVQQTQLSDRFQCGRDRMLRIIKELIVIGYIRRVTERNQHDGTFGKVEYVVVDAKADPLPDVAEASTVASVPQPEKPTAVPENPQPENPVTDNPPLLSKEDNKTEPTKERAARSPTGSRIPEGWSLTPDLGNYGRSQGLTRNEVIKEAENFKDYWVAAAGAKARKMDWDATWRTWIRRAAERLGRKPMPTGNDPEPKPDLDRGAWENTAKLFAINSNWPRDLGPEPGRPGCRMPPDLQQQFLEGRTSH